MHAGELRSLLDGAVAVTRQAAVPVLDMFRQDPQVWTKDSQGVRREARPGEGRIRNPVTEADLAADQLLREGLLELLPGSGWLSEETADTDARLGCEAVWIVDPIDGTREYVEGVPDFALSVALSVSGDPALAVLFNPARQDLFTALAGNGVWRNGEPISATARLDLDGATLLASRTETKRGEFAAFAERMQVREVGSTAYKLALLAAGEADAYFTRKPRNEWDVAAGILLCREAGSRVTDLGGADHRFNRKDPLCRGVVASSPAIHDGIMAMIGAVGTLE